ncbi:MAG: hypothetical protein F4X66_07555 [Chloroflexi bacterium]|nr:hypothetical protein [Chloroflexota bacterium]
MSGVAITSTPASGDTYGRRETIAVTVTFTEAVTVTGTPRVRILIRCVKKNPAKDCKRRAAYASGSGTTALVFHYTVKNTDVDTTASACTRTPSGGTAAPQSRIATATTRVSITRRWPLSPAIR